MIARIHGLLEQIENSAALLRCEGGLTYEVLLPAYTAARLVDRIDAVDPARHRNGYVSGSASHVKYDSRLALDKGFEHVEHLRRVRRAVEIRRRNAVVFELVGVLWCEMRWLWSRFHY